MAASGPEPVHRDPAGTDHIVQLFDGVETLADTVAVFLRDGWVQGHTLLVVATPAHWAATAERLVGLGVPIDVASEAGGRLVVRGADETMGLFMRDGRPDPVRFDASVGRLVGELVARGRPLRVFGEMVDVLAADGDYDAAEALEALWNELGRRQQFTLLCGYHAATFGDPRHSGRLRRVCRAHSHVRSSSRDPLGSFLLATHASF